MASAPFPGYDQNSAQVHPPPNQQHIQTTAESKALEEIALKKWGALEAKEAMLKECKNHMTWKKSAVEKMVVSLIQPSFTFYYVVETFYESRVTERITEPAGMGQMMIGMNNGVAAPQPWEIPCQPVQLFKDETRQLEIPNTTRIQGCAKCQGAMGRQCFSCRGNAYDDCFFCGGTGDTHKQGHHRPQYMCVRAPPANMQPVYMRVLVSGPNQCFHCRGTGAKACLHCHGVGWQFCDGCKGSGQQKTFVRLSVIYKTERSEFLTDCADIPKDKIKRSNGTVMLSEQKPLLTAMNNHKNTELNQASMQFLTEQNAKATDRLILQQRQVLTAIPVALVTYTMGESDVRVFHMYGEEKNALIKEYPSKSCSIL